MNTEDGGRNQAGFSFNQPKVIPQGDGSYIIKPGKPTQERAKITVAQAALKTGLSGDTIYRLIDAGLIDFERPSPRKIFVFVDSLDAHMANSKDPEYWNAERRKKFTEHI